MKREYQERALFLLRMSRREVCDELRANIKVLLEAIADETDEEESPDFGASCDQTKLNG